MHSRMSRRMMARSWAEQRLRLATQVIPCVNGYLKTLALNVRDTLVPPIDDQYLGPALCRAAQLRENQPRASYDPCDDCWRRVPPLGNWCYREGGRGVGSR